MANNAHADVPQINVVAAPEMEATQIGQVREGLPPLPRPSNPENIGEQTMTRLANEISVRQLTTLNAQLVSALRRLVGCTAIQRALTESRLEAPEALAEAMAALRAALPADEYDEIEEEHLIAQASDKPE